MRKISLAVILFHWLITIIGYAHIFLFMFAFCASCRGQNKPNLTKENIKSETKDTLTSTGFVHTKYEYTDSIGKHLIIQNSYPKGIKYTDPNGKDYFKFIFWTRIINETDGALELKIDFPEYSYKVPSLPGKYFKVLVLPDTMTVDKEQLHHYGIADLKSFLDKNIHKPSSLKRTINPTESSGFFVVILFDKGVAGPIRTGLSIKGQNLFYKVARLAARRYEGKLDVQLVDEKEINCGSINLKNLVLRKITNTSTP